MEIDKIELQKIIEQEIKPNESIIVWTDYYIKAVRETLNEQILDHAVEPDVAKSRLIKYIIDRLEGELRVDQV